MMYKMISNSPSCMASSSCFCRPCRLGSCCRRISCLTDLQIKGVWYENKWQEFTLRSCHHKRLPLEAVTSEHLVCRNWISLWRNWWKHLPVICLLVREAAPLDKIPTESSLGPLHGWLSGEGSEIQKPQSWLSGEFLLQPRKPSLL